MWFCFRQCQFQILGHVETCTPYPYLIVSKIILYINCEEWEQDIQVSCDIFEQIFTVISNPDNKLLYHHFLRFILTIKFVLIQIQILDYTFIQVGFLFQDLSHHTIWLNVMNSLLFLREMYFSRVSLISYEPKLFQLSFLVLGFIEFPTTINVILLDTRISLDSTPPPFCQLSSVKFMSTLLHGEFLLNNILLPDLNVTV